MNIILYLFAMFKLTSSDPWCDGLQKLYEEFSEFHKYQKNPEKYNVDSIGDWGNGTAVNTKSVMYLSPENYDTFRTKISTKLPSKIETDQIKEASNLIKLMFKIKPSIYCDGETKLVMKGNILKISDLPLNKTCGEKPLKSIEVLAADKIFFDKDVNLTGRYLLLAIIAPNWEVVRPIVINMNGSTQSPKETPKKPADPKTPGIDGDDGVAGATGGTAGSFFGMGMKFTSLENLSIIANGEHGTDGQDGGDGSDGEEGKHAQIYKNKYRCELRTHLEDKYAGPYNTMEDQKDIKICFGQEGTQGGASGRGGVGGYGGKKGYVLLLDFKLNNKTTSVQVQNKDGHRGNDGTPGKPGKQGPPGRAVRARVGLSLMDVSLDEKTYEKELEKDRPLGIDRSNETSNISLTEPDDTIPIDKYASMILNDFKHYLLDSLSNDVIRTRSFNLLFDLLNDTNITSLHDTEGVIKQVLNLEEHYFFLYDKINLLPLYETILNQTERRVLIETNAEDKQSLIFLYTTLQGKISTYESTGSGRFIADLEGFLGMFMANAKLLRRNKEEEAILNYNNRYNQEIDDQIEEAEQLIHDEVMSNVQVVTDKIEHQIQNLLGEIEETKKRRKQEEKEVSDLRNKVSGELGKKIFLQVLGFTTKIIAQSSRLSKFSKHLVQKTPEVIGLLMTPTDFSPIHDIQKDLEKTHMDLNGIYQQLDPKESKEVRKNYMMVAKHVNEIGFDIYEEIKKNVKGKIKIHLPKSLSKLKGKISADGTKKAIEFSLAAANEIWIMSEYIKQHKDLANSIDDLTDSLENDIYAAQKIQENIGNVLAPSIKKMGDFLSSLETSLKHKSSVNIKIVELGVQEMLTNLKQVLQGESAKHFAGQEITKMLDELMDLIHTMINVYSKIQAFEQKKKFADHVANVNSVSYRSVMINDKKLLNINSKLKVALQSNIILLDYKQSINQLKQFVFPLAKDFFKKFALPQFLQSAVGNSENYVQHVIGELKTYQEELAKSEIYYTKYDTFKIRAQFSSAFQITSPFFVWKNDEYNEQIVNLLKGKKVLLRSKLNRHLDKNAIKFNNINLNFKTKFNQDQLDDILENFMIILTHIGYNHYNCNNKTYIVITEKLQFVLSYKKFKEQPVNMNLAYNKLVNGNFLLSPFTLWGIQLTKVTSVNFDLLKPFQDFVDLELVGEGEYFENMVDICEDVDEYYELLSESKKLNETKKPYIYCQMKNFTFN